MTENTIKKSDELYYALAALDGWNMCLNDAREYQSNAGVFGSIVSSLLVATNEGEDALALAGSLDDNGVGFVVVLTSSGVLRLATNQETGLGNGQVSFELSFSPYSTASDLSVRVPHNYFNGVTSRPRHERMSFAFKIDAKDYKFSPRNYDAGPLNDSNAILAAYNAVRDGIARQTAAI